MASAVALHQVAPPSSSPDSLVLLTCVRDATLRARLQEALRGRGVVNCFATLADLITSLRSSDCNADVVVVPPRDSAGREASPAVREIATLFPHVALIAYCQSGVESSMDIRGLAVAGAHEFLFAGEDTRAVIRGVLENARRECAAERVFSVLARVLPAKVHPIVELCLARPAAIVSVDQLASATGLHRKTLYNQCVQAGAPGPAELVNWCRLGIIAYLLTRSGRTVESLANELEFASPTALRNMIKRYTGLRAREIRASGGVECVARALAAKISDQPPRLRIVSA